MFWIGTNGGGLNKFDRETEKFISYKADKNNQFSISSNLVMAIYEDEDSIFWIGTNGGGLNKFDRNTELVFYDVTNYYFETNRTDELKRKGTGIQDHSKRRTQGYRATVP